MIARCSERRTGLQSPGIISTYTWVTPRVSAKIAKKQMSETQSSGSAAPQPPREDTRRIAVVAIHGVGDHAQFATAREIGDLLSNLEYKPGNTPRYAPFTEVVKRINVRPVNVPHWKGGFNWADREFQRRTWGPMHALAKACFRGLRAPRIDDAGHSIDSLDHLFMKGQLAEYRGENPKDTYQCLRLEGKRVAPAADRSPPAPDTAGEIALQLRESGVQLPSQPTGAAAGLEGARADVNPAAPGTQEKIVHLYEMYWSDLSELGSGFARIFGELCQLLFHLGAVSVNNVLAGAIHFQQTQDEGKPDEEKPDEGKVAAQMPDAANRAAAKKWAVFSRAQGFAAAVLAWPIPILNLLMAAVVPVILLISLMRTRLSSQGEYIALDALVTALLVAGSGYALIRLPRFPAFLYPLPFVLFGAFGTAIGFLEPLNRNVTESIATAILLTLFFALVWVIVGVYDKYRPGSKRAAMWIGALLAATVLVGAVFRRGLPLGHANGI